MVVFLWWCSCGGVFVVVWWCGGVLCFCGGAFVCFLSAVESTFVTLPRSYAKSVDNTGVKRCLV